MDAHNATEAHEAYLHVPFRWNRFHPLGQMSLRGAENRFTFHRCRRCRNQHTNTHRLRTHRLAAANYLFPKTLCNTIVASRLLLLLWLLKDIDFASPHGIGPTRWTSCPIIITIARSLPLPPPLPPTAPFAKPSCLYLLKTPTIFTYMWVELLLLL